MKQYNAQYFIEKFSKIGDDFWCKGQLETVKGTHCALGHCGVRDEHIEMKGQIKHKEGNALSNLLRKLNNIDDNRSINPYEIVYYINDGYKYGETPKENIIKALEEVKIIEQGDRAIEIVNNIIKEEKLELV